MSAISFSKPKTFFAGGRPPEEIVKQSIHQNPAEPSVKMTETTVLQAGQREPVEIFTAQVPQHVAKHPVKKAPIEWEKQLARWGKRMERIMIVASMIPVMIATLTATVVRVIASLFKERGRLKNTFHPNQVPSDPSNKMKVAGNLLKSKFDEMFDRSKKALSSSQTYQSVNAKPPTGKSAVAALTGNKPQSQGFKETIRDFFAPYPPEVVNTRRKSAKSAKPSAQ